MFQKPFEIFSQGSANWREANYFLQNLKSAFARFCFNFSTCDDFGKMFFLRTCTARASEPSSTRSSMTSFKKFCLSRTLQLMLQLNYGQLETRRIDVKYFVVVLSCVYRFRQKIHYDGRYLSLYTWSPIWLVWIMWFQYIKLTMFVLMCSNPIQLNWRLANTVILLPWWVCSGLGHAGNLIISIEELK